MRTGTTSKTATVMFFNIKNSVLTVALLFSLVACEQGQTPATQNKSDINPPDKKVTPSISPFADVTESSGLDFIHHNGGTGEFYMPEIMGAGGALIDVDADGDLDVYLVQGGPLDNQTTPLTDQLWRNDTTISSAGEKIIQFTNITDTANIAPGGYGMGATTGDIDGDGLSDLYVSNFGDNRLLKNLGDGRFQDVTAESGTNDDSWSVPATFLDVDGDGDLDLFSGSYVDFRIANHRDCFSATGLPDFCSPHSYNAVTDRLFLNRGDGTFENASAAAGLRQVPSKALGVITGDFNADGLTDFYVANDGVANQLWLNQGDGTFEENALFAGCALNAEGLPEASMGVDAADVDADGDEDIFMTHLRGETNTLYINHGDGSFEDRTIRMGLGGPSIPYTGFGTAWFDVDNDGRLDLLAANGAVTVEERLVAQGDPYPYHQPNQLFKNISQGSSLEFESFPHGKDDPLAKSEVSRGALFGDLDNDGDIDVIITNNSGPAQVLQNQLGQNNNWLGLELRLFEQGSIALGAGVRLLAGEEHAQFRRVRSAGSYVSGNDPRVLFGLGNGNIEQSYLIEVSWVGGQTERFGPLAANQYHEIVKGQGSPLDGNKP